MRITITAITRSIWMNPPSVKELTTPRSHKITRMIAIVVNIRFWLNL